MDDCGSSADHKPVCGSFLAKCGPQMDLRPIDEPQNQNQNLSADCADDADIPSAINQRNLRNQRTTKESPHEDQIQKQQFQSDAVKAIVDCFAGLSPICGR
jgi:hypothetical protein